VPEQFRLQELCVNHEGGGQTDGITGESVIAACNSKPGPDTAPTKYS